METQNYDAMYNKFRQQERNIRVGPVENRKCQDICCLLLFILLILAFIGIGVYYLVTANEGLSWEFNKLSTFSRPLTVIKQLLVKYWPVILGMFALSFLLSIVFMLLLRYCTKCMVYTMFVMVVLILGGIIGVSIVSKAWGALIAASVSLLIFLCFLCCFRNAIKRGIVLLKTTMKFLKQRSRVFLIPFLCFILFLLFLAFWLITLICMQYQASQDAMSSFQHAKEIAFYTIWIVMIIFMTLFLYYVMVFLIGYCCANWFYGHHNSGICRGFGHINKSHIGSLTFASILVTIVKIIQLLIQSAARQSNNCCASCCLCLLACCMSAIQYILKILNKFGVIAMSLTGQSYWESAKTGAGVIMRDFDLFWVTQTMAQIIKYGGIIFAAGLPTLIGYLLLYAIYLHNWNQYSYEVTVYIFFIFCVCLAISVFFVSTISIALCAVFFFYCLDRRFRQVGVNVQGAPYYLKRMTQQMQRNNNDVVPHSAERF